MNIYTLFYEINSTYYYIEADSCLLKSWQLKSTFFKINPSHAEPEYVLF